MREGGLGREKRQWRGWRAPEAEQHKKQQDDKAEEEHNPLEPRGLLHLVGGGEAGEGLHHTGRLEDREAGFVILRRKRTGAKVSDVRRGPKHARVPRLA